MREFRHGYEVKGVGKAEIITSYTEYVRDGKVDELGDANVQYS
jgi:hypothetical protein